MPITFPADLAQTPRPELPGLGTPWGTPTTIRYNEGAEVGYHHADHRRMALEYTHADSVCAGIAAVPAEDWRSSLQSYEEAGRERIEIDTERQPDGASGRDGLGRRPRSGGRAAAPGWSRFDHH